MKNSNTNSPTWSQHLFIHSIEAYRLSRPLLRQLNMSVFGVHSECHQTPTCSEFTIRSIKKHGTIRGLSMGIQRILACR